MTIHEMALSYLESSRSCRARLRSLRVQLLQDSSLCENDRLLLRRRLRLLQAMADETHAVGLYLQNYYPKGGTGLETSQP